MHEGSSELPHNEDVLADQSVSSARPPGGPPPQESSPPQLQSGPVDKIARLLQFASNGRVDAVRKILDEGLDVNSKDYDGRTALHLAASEGNYKVVELLLERNASVNPVDRRGDTDAMRYVRGDKRKQEEYRKVYEYLAEKGGQGTNQVEHGEAEEQEQQEQMEQLQEEYEIDREELLDLSSATSNKAKTIGMGSYGQVFLVKWRGTNVAAKMILQTLAQKEEIKKEFRMELILLQSLRHPNIVEFLGAVTKSNPLVIVTEYLPNGDLHDIIQRRGRIPAKDAVSYALDIAKGMNYLHQHKPKAIVHRDLKPRNLLQDEAGHLKVADFGLSKLLEPKPRRESDFYNMTGGTGTYRYMAPEVFLHQHYDKSVDVFSFGIIVQEIFEGGQVLLSSPAHEVAQARAQTDKRPAFFARTYPPGMKDLLERCWQREPARRPTFEAIINVLEPMHDSLKSTSKWTPNLIIENLTAKMSRLVGDRRGMSSSVSRSLRGRGPSQEGTVSIRSRKQRKSVSGSFSTDSHPGTSSSQPSTQDSGSVFTDSHPGSSSSEPSTQDSGIVFTQSHPGSSTSQPSTQDSGILFTDSHPGTSSAQPSTQDSGIVFPDSHPGSDSLPSVFGGGGDNNRP